MLVDFTVENYLSILKERTLTFKAITFTSKKLDGNFIKKDKRFSLLKSSLIFGANSSGKTSLLKSIKTMSNLVLNGGAIIDTKYSMFNSKDLELKTYLENDKPIKFKISFYIGEALYFYSFEIKGFEIISEHLSYRKDESSKINYVFNRDGMLLKINGNFRKLRKYVERISSKKLFLSKLAILEEPFFVNIIDNFFNKINILEMSSINKGSADKITKSFLNKVSNNSVLLKRISETMASLDLGLHGIEIENSQIKAVFNVDDKIIKVDFFEFVSAGTINIFVLVSELLQSITDNSLLLIDNYSMNVHPDLAKYLLKGFMASESEAQLILTSHNSNLMDINILRRDQIWVMENHELEGSSLFSMESLKIRHDVVLERNYLKGVFGGVPTILNKSENKNKLDINKRTLELAKLYGIDISDGKDHTYEKDNGEVVIVNNNNITEIFGDIFSSMNKITRDLDNLSESEIEQKIEDAKDGPISKAFNN